MMTIELIIGVVALIIASFTLAEAHTIRKNREIEKKELKEYAKETCFLYILNVRDALKPIITINNKNEILNETEKGNLGLSLKKYRLSLENLDNRLIKNGNVLEKELEYNLSKITRDMKEELLVAIIHNRGVVGFFDLHDKRLQGQLKWKFKKEFINWFSKEEFDELES